MKKLILKSSVLAAVLMAFSVTCLGFTPLSVKVTNNRKGVLYGVQDETNPVVENLGKFEGNTNTYEMKKNGNPGRYLYFGHPTKNAGKDDYNQLNGGYRIRYAVSTGNPNGAVHVSIMDGGGAAAEVSLDGGSPKKVTSDTAFPLKKLDSKMTVTFVPGT